MLFLSLLYYIVSSKLTNKLTGPSLEPYGIQPTMVGIYNNVKLDFDMLTQGLESIRTCSMCMGMLNNHSTSNNIITCTGGMV
jgi:hypothetical protein